MGLKGKRGEPLTDEEVIEISQKFEEKKESIKNDKLFSETNISNDKILDSVCREYDLDSINLVDDRTLEIFKLYQYYKYSTPHKINNAVFFEAVVLLRQLEPRLF